MAEQTVGKLNVDIETRLDRLDRDLRTLENKVKKATDRIDKESQINPFSGIVEFAAKALATMGAVELGIKSLSVASQALNGDWEAVSESVKQLPAGIGGVAQGIDSLLRSVSGVTAEMKRVNEEMARLDQKLARAQQRNQTVSRLRGVSESTLEDLRHQLDVLTSPNELTAATIALQRDRDKAIADIQQRTQSALQNTRAGSGTAREFRQAEREQIDLINRIYDTRIGLIADRLDEEEARKSRLASEQHQREIEAEKRKQEQLARAAEAADRKRKVEADKAFSRAQRLADVESKIRQNILRSEGRDRDALFERIRANYDRQVREAGRAGDRELASRLRTLRKLELAQIRHNKRSEQFAAIDPTLEAFGRERRGPDRAPVGTERNVPSASFSGADVGPFPFGDNKPLPIKGDKQQTAILNRIESNTRNAIATAG